MHGVLAVARVIPSFRLWISSLRGAGSTGTLADPCAMNVTVYFWCNRRRSWLGRTLVLLGVQVLQEFTVLMVVEQRQQDRPLLDIFEVDPKEAPGTP